jgi:site-specific recombinase XerD
MRGEVSVMDDRIGHFLHFLSAEKGASDNTVAAYRNDLSQFHSFLSTLNLNGDNPDWTCVKKETIVAYVLELKERRYAEAAARRQVPAQAADRPAGRRVVGAAVEA